MEISLGHDSNASHSQRSSDKEDSYFIVHALSLDYGLALTERDTLLLRAGLHTEAHDQASGLTQARLSGLARISHRFDNPLLPVIAGWSSIAVREYNSGLRDSNEYRAGIYLTQNLGESVLGRLGFSGAKRNADSKVFNLEGNTASLDIDWMASDSITIYGGLQYYDGDVTSSASRYGNPLPYASLYAQDENTWDDVFRNYRVYRLDADARTYSLGVSFGLTRGLALDLRAQSIDTEADAGGNYKRRVVLVGLLARI